MTRRKLPRYVRRHGSGYRAVIQIDGRRIVGPVCRTPQEASDYAARYKAARPPDRPLTLADGFDHLMDHLRARGARDGTLDHYAKHWAIITRRTGWSPTIPLHRITVAQVMRYVAARVVSGGPSLETVWTKEVQLLERILNQAHADDLLPFRPLAKLQKPRLRHRRFPVLTRPRIDELVAAIRAAPRGRFRDRDADLVEFLGLTGLRRAEVARLTAGSIDFDASTIHIDGKTGPRVLPLTARTADILRAAIDREGDGPVFGSPRRIEKVFARWRIALDEPRLSPHTMRHSFATDAVRRGVHLLDLMAMLGHASPTQTARYYHADASRLTDSMP